MLGVPEDTSALLAKAATILLGAPLIWVAIHDMARAHMHMNELVALAELGEFAKGWYFEAGSIGCLDEPQPKLSGQARTDELPSPSRSKGETGQNHMPGTTYRPRSRCQWMPQSVVKTMSLRVSLGTKNISW